MENFIAMVYILAMFSTLALKIRLCIYNTIQHCRTRWQHYRVTAVMGIAATDTTGRTRWQHYRVTAVMGTAATDTTGRTKHVGSNSPGCKIS